MGEFAKYNAQNVLEIVDRYIAELESISDKDYSDIMDLVDWNRHKVIRYNYRKGTRKYAFYIGEVFDELSIFDWWNETLSISQLKQMKSFLETAIKLGFTGYVCFKVGATGCSHGMWASTEESTNGYSPKDGNTLFHSFRSGDCYWSGCINGEWMGNHDKYEFTLKEVKDALGA